MTVLFSTYVTKQVLDYTTKVEARIEGRLLNVKTGRHLGNFEVESNGSWNVPKNCNRPCIINSVGKKSRILANDLGLVLAEKLDWLRMGESDVATSDSKSKASSNNGFITEYSLIFDGFTAEDYASIEEYLVIFSGYKSHRPVESLHTYRDIWYKSAIGTSKLSRNLQKTLAQLDLRGTVNFDGHTYTVKKITLRGKKAPLSNNTEW